MQQKDKLDQQAIVAAKEHMGGFAWPTVIFAGTVIAGYLATLALGFAGILSLWLAVPLVAVLTYLAYTVLHESAHGTISGSNTSRRWLNEALGYAAAWILMIPLTAHRHEHLVHHRNTNDDEGDPDFIVSSMFKSPLQMFMLAPQLLWKQFEYYLNNRWGRGPRSQDRILCLEIFVALLPRLGLIAVGFWVEGLALFLLAWLAGITLLMYLFAYIVHRPHEDRGRYVDTSTIIVEGPLGTIITWLWVYQNYHSIHHLFPRVPFYRYPALFGEIEGIMAQKGAPIYRLGFRGLRPHAAATA